MGAIGKEWLHKEEGRSKKEEVKKEKERSKKEEVKKKEEKGKNLYGITSMGQHRKIKSNTKKRRISCIQEMRRKIRIEIKNKKSGKKKREGNHKKEEGIVYTIKCKDCNKIYIGE